MDSFQFHNAPENGKTLEDHPAKKSLEKVVNIVKEEPREQLHFSSSVVNKLH